MNILRKSRKSLNRISKKRLLLVIFSLIMTSFAWIAYSKILSPSLDVHIASWNVKFFVDSNKNMVAEDFEEQTASKDNPDATGRTVEVAINTLYPGMDEDIIDVIIRNDGEVPSGITYGINNITMLGQSYELGTDIVEHTPSFDDGIKTYVFINELQKFPFKITIENTELVRNGAEGYLKVRVVWPLEKTGSQTDDTKNALDTTWGFNATEYVEATGEAPIKFNLQIHATGSDPNVIDYAKNSFVSQVTPANYGEEVNYSVDLDGDASTNDWVIFCEHRNNVFLIAKDYIKNTLVPETTMKRTLITQYATYGVSFSDDHFSTSISKNIINRYMLYYAKDNGKNNYKSTARLLDKDKWINFLDGNYAESAVGAPTVEMFVKSWNQIKYNDEENYDDYSELIISWDSLNEGYKINNLTTIIPDGAELSSLHFPARRTGDSSLGYWLASMGCNLEGSHPRLLGINCQVKRIGVAGYTYEGMAARPVVCIKETVKASKSGSVWILGE